MYDHTTHSTKYKSNFHVWHMHKWPDLIWPDQATTLFRSIKVLNYQIRLNKKYHYHNLSNSYHNLTMTMTGMNINENLNFTCNLICTYLSYDWDVVMFSWLTVICMWGTVTFGTHGHWVGSEYYRELINDQSRYPRTCWNLIGLQ